MKKKDYLIVSILVLITLGVIYCVKGFFPFGNNYIIWGDMHSQIVPLYYKFYDAIYQNQSFLIDFSSGGGISLLGIFAYYISSPLTLLVLLFPRNMIVHAPAIIIGLKIVLCSITALYCIKRYFKKVPSMVQILLAFLYAFSIYNFAHYIITGWIDVVYLFPLLMVGLKELIDGKQKKLYFIILTLSFLMNFYLTFMVLLFIILCVFLYLKIFKVEKEKQKEIILNLGINTLISLLCSSVILIPTFLEMGSSIRTGLDINKVLHSRFGPYMDKISYLFLSGLGICSALLMMWKNRKEKVGYFIFGILCLLILPIVIEPINKMWHFGSYVFYPSRFGFILSFVFIMIAAFYFNQLEEVQTSKKKSILIFGVSILFSLIYLFLTNHYYTSIQNCITNLTFSTEKIGFLILFFLFLLSLVTIGIILVLGKKQRISIISLWLVSFVMVVCNGFLYFGIDHEQKELQSAYHIMNQLHQDISEKESRLKSEVPLITWNFGMVVGSQTLDHFTSLTGESAFIANQKLGYDSYWMDTLSNGGNLFVDTVFRHQYLITDQKNEFYTDVKKYESLFLQKSKLPMPSGYFIDDPIDISNQKNSFEVTNQLSKSLFEDNVFDIYELNVTTMEKIIPLDKKKAIYLETSNGYDNSKKTKIYHTFRIYVNDELIMEQYPNRNNVNSIYLGTFDQDVTIKIEVLKEATVDYLVLGVLDIDKVESYFLERFNDIDIRYQKNKILIEADNKDNKKYLFLPINYLEGMKATNNGKEVSIVKIMDNYIGIPLEKNHNEIQLIYITPGLKLGMLLSIIGVISAILYFKLQHVFFKTWLQNIGYFLFSIIFLLELVLLYIIPICAFLFYLIF